MEVTGDSRQVPKGNGMKAAAGGGPAMGGGGVGGLAGGPAAPAGGAGDGSGVQVGVQLSGGAAIVAPVSAFPNGVPGNALIVLPLNPVGDELKGLLEKGPVAVTPDQMWKLLGFNGPAVQVQDDQGRPIAIGLEDLLVALDKNWLENPDDLNRGRIYAQELLKYGKLERAEKVLARLVGSGSAAGDDWLAWGVTQLQLERHDKAEGTLKGAQNLMPENPYPSLHLAKLAQARSKPDDEREMIRRAISIDRRCVDAWAYYFEFLRRTGSEDDALATIEKEAATLANDKNAAPYIAVQGFYAAEEATRDKAIEWAKKGVDKNTDDPLAILVLSALYGQKGDFDAVIALLQPHEPKMMRDVRLAHNYFEALFQSKQIDKVTKLLNALAASPDKQVKQFAIERSKGVAQFLQQQQQQLIANVNRQSSPGTGPAPGAGGRQN
jgi:tetratricopeptide (TPR) repeat protein